MATAAAMWLHHWDGAGRTDGRKDGLRPGRLEGRVGGAERLPKVRRKFDEDRPTDAAESSTKLRRNSGSKLRVVVSFLMDDRPYKVHCTCVLVLHT